MVAKDERYYIQFENVNGTKIGNPADSFEFDEIVIDVVPKVVEDSAYYTKKPHICFMSKERKNQVKNGKKIQDIYTHDILGFIEFKNQKNLEMAQKGLRMLDEAICLEADGE